MSPGRCRASGERAEILETCGSSDFGDVVDVEVLKIFFWNLFLNYYKSASEDVDEDVRAMGVELCVTIGESLPGAVRKKVPKAIADLCLVCLKMMAEIDEDAEWGGKTVPEDDDEDLPQGGVWLRYLKISN